MKKLKKIFQKKIKTIWRLVFPVSHARKPDGVFFAVAIALVLFGLVMLASASSVVGLTRYGDTYFFLKRQIVQGLSFGVVGFVLMYRVSLLTLKKWSFYIFAISLLFLILVLMPQFGDERLGASRWLTFGGFSFQPTELIKLTFILYLAAWLDKQKSEIRNFKKTFVPFIVIVLIVSGLVILQPDMGTMGVFIAIAMTVYFAAGGSILHLFSLSIVGFGSLWFLIKTATYRAARLTIFLDPSQDPQGKGYHIRQAWLAIGSGGLIGRGLGRSRQKFQYLPESYGDSIFAIIAEELGFIAVIVVISLFLYFFLRGLSIARRVPDFYSSLVVVGIISWWAWQMIINIGSMVGLLPLTGVPWPFVSYGATSLAINITALGLVLNISRQVKK